MEEMVNQVTPAPEQEPQAEPVGEALEPVVDQSESIESLMGDQPQPTQETVSEEADDAGTSGTNEPGYVRKRIDKALAKQAAELQAQFDAKLEEALAPFKEQLVEQQARELVRNGSVKDIETAKELVRYRQNQPQPVKEQPKENGSQQPRNDKGQFATQPDPAIKARVAMLDHQAKMIQERSGIDVTDVFMKDPDIKQKVLSGEWDFYDVADSMNRQQTKKPPSPMRSPNGASGAEKSTIASMSAEQFAKLEKNLKEGKRYSI